jgi:hypothetical protein
MSSGAPLSGYDLTYVHLSDAERTKLTGALSDMLQKSVEEANKNLILSVQKAATAMYQELLANPWPQLLKENGGTYEFLQGMADQVWQVMLTSNPKDLNKHRWYSMQDLVDAWIENYPGEWEKIVEDSTAKTIKSLQDRIRFLEGLNQYR